MLDRVAVRDEQLADELGGEEAVVDDAGNRVQARGERAGVGEIGRQVGQHAYDALRRRIIRCELAPGRTFTEASVAEELGIGRTPVREALARLAREGFVVVAPRAGCRVSEVTLGDVMELFELREPLETKAAELAASRIDGPGLDELQRLTDVPFVEDAADAAGLAAFLGANTAFHSAVARYAGNGRLRATLDGIADQLERLHWLGVPTSPRVGDMLGDHREMIAALAARDGEHAAALALRHCRTSRQVVVDAVLESGVLHGAAIHHDANEERR
ncbi:GntR family transcriptional regulator [Patulibacter sp. S7RM1-6]